VSTRLQSATHAQTDCHIPYSPSALAISKGTHRDRAPGQSGSKLSVFGRRGAHPFNRQEMKGMYLKDNKLITVVDEFLTEPRQDEIKPTWTQSSISANR
jgi:hypothetical protein